MKQIQSEYSCGSIISILGFNYFHLDSADDYVEEIFKAVARNFFIRIKSQKLLVSCNGLEMTDSLLEINMERYKSQRRKNNKIEVLSGNKAFCDYKTILREPKELISTELGTFGLQIREAESNERTRISLYRQGMYITDEIPFNSPAKYSDYQPFNAVISIDADQSNSEVFQLIRRAEGPKHLELDENRLQQGKRYKFNKFFSTVNEEIANRCKKASTETFAPSIFTFLTEDSKQSSNKSGSTKSTNTNSEQLAEVPGGSISFPTGGGRNGPKSKLGRNTTVHKDRSSPIKVVAKRNQNQNSIDLVLLAEKKIYDAQLNLNIHSGSDSSCISPLPDRPVKYFIKSIDGISVDKTKKIGQLEAGQKKMLSLSVIENLEPNVVIKVSVNDAGENN